MMDSTVIIGYAGGYCQARISKNYKTNKWTLEYMHIECVDINDSPMVLDKQKPIQSFDTPRQALDVLISELGW
jgi:hypothetical protein